MTLTHEQKERVIKRYLTNNCHDLQKSEEILNRIKFSKLRKEKTSFMNAYELDKVLELVNSLPEDEENLKPEQIIELQINKPRIVRNVNFRERTKSPLEIYQTLRKPIRDEEGKIVK